jgi:hypothetical protein
VQDLVNDHEFSPFLAVNLLEIPRAHKNDTTPRLCERRGLPPALGLVAAIGKLHEPQNVICGLDSQPDEIRLNRIP